MKRATGLVNAVLRRFVSERSVLFERIDARLAARTAHPAWLVEQISAAWPQQAPEILLANNAHPPMTLRVDRSRAAAADYAARLAARSIGAHLIQWAPAAVGLDQPIGVRDLPGFDETGRHFRLHDRANPVRIVLFMNSVHPWHASLEHRGHHKAETKMAALPRLSYGPW